MQDDKKYLESIEVKTDGSLKVPLHFNQRLHRQVDNVMMSKAEKIVQTSPQVSKTFVEKSHADFNVIEKPSTSAKLDEDVIESKLVRKEVKIFIFLTFRKTVVVFQNRYLYLLKS